MGLTNFSGGLASFGVPVLPPLMPVTTGSVFFVCNQTNANGSDGNSGLSPSQPLATVDAAIGKCTASKGDVIYVMPGHAETVTATSIAHDIAGVQVIGLGTGTIRPTFTFSTAAATITVSAANGSWRNCRFLGNFADVAAAFTIGAAVGCEITDNVFQDVDSTHNFLSCVVTGAVANAADGLTFSRNKVRSLVVTDGAVVSILGDLRGAEINDNNVSKSATNDAGHMITAAALVVTDLVCLRNTLAMKALASQSTGTFITGSSTTSSGMIALNFVYQIDTTTALFATTGQKFGYIENYLAGTADKSGFIFPVAEDPA